MALGIGKGTLLGIGYIAITADTADAETSLGKVGIGLAGAATAVLAVGAAAAVTVHMANDFNNAMLKIQTQAGGSAADVKVLSNAVLNLSTAQQGPDQLAEALYHLKSVGLDNTTAMKDLKVASDLASVGGSNLEATTNALAGAWRSGIKGAQTFGEAAGTVNAIIGAGNMTMTEFVGAVGTGILPAAKTFGIGLNQVGAALALMTDSGQGAEEAATRLKTSFSLLAAPSATAAKQLATIGLTGLQMANEMRSPAGLVGTIGLLKAALDKSGLSLSQQGILLSKAFGGGKSASTIEALVQNYSVLQGKLVQINKTAGDLPAAVAAQQKTLSAQFAMMKTNLEDFGIKVGEALLPPVTAFVTFLNTTLIPSASRVTTAMVNMIPTKAIQSGLNTLTQVMGGFFKSNFGTTTKAQMAPAMTLNRGGVNKSLMPTTSVANPAASMGSQLTKEFSSSFASIGSIASIAFKGVESIMSTGVTVIKEIVTKGLPAVGGVFSNVLGVIQTVVSVGMPIVTGAFKIAANFIDNTVIPSFRNLTIFINPLLQMISPLAQLVGDVLGPALSLVGVTLNNVIGPAFRGLTGFLAQNKTLITSLAITIGVFTAGLLLLNIQMIAGGIALKIYNLWCGIVTVATKLQTIAQGALDLVMDANPIMLVVLGLTALAAGFAYAWTHSQLFRSIMESIGEWFAGPFVNFFIDIGNWFAGPFVNFFLDIGRWFSGPFVNFFIDIGRWFTGPFVGFFLSIGNWFTGPFVGFFLDIGRWFTGPFVNFFLNIGRWFTGPFVNFFLSIGNWFTGPFVGFFLSIGRWFTGPFVNFFLNIGNWFAGPFVNFFVSAWHVIQSAALGAYNFLFNDVIHPIESAFMWLWTNGIEPALRFIVNGFMTMVGDVLHGASDMLGWVPGVGGKLKSAEKAFDNFRASVNASLGGIQNKTVNLSVDFNNAATAGNKKGLPGLAFGGPVGGIGTATSDSNLTWLSKGEHVWTADEVNALGGQQAMLTLRQMVKAGRIGKFSVGGAVGVHVTEPTSNTVTRDIAAWTQAFSQSNAASIYAAVTAAASANSGLNNNGGFSGVAAGAAQNYAQSLLGRYYWSSNQMGPLIKLWNQESGWRWNALNASSGAYGIPQALPADKMASAGPDWHSNYQTQIRWGLGYIAGRYGSPGAAWSHEMCVPLSVEILTQRGWLTYENVQIGDMTVGYNPGTERNEWTRVTDIHRYDDVPVVRLTNKTWHAVCTPHHRWVAVHRKHVGRKGVGGRTKNEFRTDDVFVEAQKITTRHTLRLAAPSDVGENASVSLQEAELLGWVLGDGWVIKPKSRTPNSTHWRTLRGSRPSIRLGQSKPEHVKAIESLVSGLPFTRTVRPMTKPSGEPGLPLTTWEFHRPWSAELLRRSGYDHADPVPFVLSLSEPQREAFLRGVFGAEGVTKIQEGPILGKGHYSGGKSYSQADGAQQDAIVLAVYLSGKRPAMTEWKRSGRSNLGCTTPRTGVAIREAKPFLGGESIRTGDAGTESVWCATTELGSWTMRQDRQPMLTGNSNNWYDSGGYLPVGRSIANNGTGRPERVLGPGQSAGGGELHVHAHFHGPVGSRHELQNWLISALQDAKQHGRLRGLIPGV
jgi:TP901 family phage tail tape measure protein